MPEEFPTNIESDTQVGFTVDQFGLYAITVIASCEKKHDLRLEIDGLHQTYNNPSSWNGTNLKGLSKTVTFILTLDKGLHTLKLFPRHEAYIKKLDYRLIQNFKGFEFRIEEKAEEGDRRPWVTFALINIPLKSVVAEASVSWHLFDGDDIKIIIDGEVEKNANSRLWKYWVWHAMPQQILTGSKREQKLFSKDLPQGVHYIEFWADRTPTLHKVVLDLGNSHSRRIPTKDDPKWTEDFNDDTDEIILARLVFGEARNQSKEAMVGVAWVIKNRLLAKRIYFGFNYHEIILKNDGSSYQFLSFKPTDPNYLMLTNPLSGADNITNKAWFDAYETALGVINETISDPTDGATFFHSSDLSQEKFLKDNVPGAVFTKQIEDLLFYKDPNEI